MYDPSDFLAGMDQAQSGMKDIAKVTAAFYTGLVEAGVPMSHAGPITAAYFGGGYATHVALSKSERDE